MLNSPSLAQLTLNCSSTDLYQFNGILEKWRILMKDLKTWDDNYSLTSCDAKLTALYCNQSPKRELWIFSLHYHSVAGQAW